MNSPTVQIRLHRAGLTDPKPLPVRHDRPPTQITPRIIRPSFAGHDFLVPNPIRASRSEDARAELAELMNFLKASEEAIKETQIHDVLALDGFARGDLELARREALESNAMQPYPPIVQIAVRASLWRLSSADAGSDLETLRATGSHGLFPDAQLAVFAAGVAALEGDLPTALTLYNDGRRVLRDNGLRYPLALSGIDMALLLPNEAATADAIAEAREILTELRATPFLERLEQAAATAAPTRARSSANARSEVAAS